MFSALAKTNFNFSVAFIFSSANAFNLDQSEIRLVKSKQKGHDAPVSLHWLIREVHSYQTLHYLGIGLKQDLLQGLKLVAIVLMFRNKKISKDFTI